MRLTARFKGQSFPFSKNQQSSVSSLSISEGNASDKLMDLEQQLKEAKLVAEESDR
jgi:hypothetical protein